MGQLQGVDQGTQVHVVEAGVGSPSTQSKLKLADAVSDVSILLGGLGGK